MSLAKPNVRYKYALLYIYRGGDPLNMVAKYGLLLTDLKKLYSEYKPLMENKSFRLEIINELLEHNFSDEEIAEVINWSDFEEYIAYYFNENGFKVLRNYRIGKQRKEIDVLAYSGNIVFCIECKHWDKIIAVSSLKRIISHHVEKCRLLHTQNNFILSKIYPLIITLRSPRKYYISNVLVIPIKGIKEFLSKYRELIIEKILRDVNELELH